MKNKRGASNRKFVCWKTRIIQRQVPCLIKYSLGLGAPNNRGVLTSGTRRWNILNAGVEQLWQIVACVMSYVKKCDGIQSERPTKYCRICDEMPASVTNIFPNIQWKYWLLLLEYHIFMFCCIFRVVSDRIIWICFADIIILFADT